jgi:hypothetical protein
MGIAVDEDVFERWQKSRGTRRKARIGVAGKIILGLGIIAAAAASFGVILLATPSKLVATVQGQVVKTEYDWDDEDIDEDARKWLERHITVRLDSGEKAGVDLPLDEEVRMDAQVKLDVYRKVIGPVSMEFHKFAGYVDAAK